MNRNLSPFAWAAAMLAVSLASMMEWLPASSAAGLIVILVAGMTATGHARCGRFSKAER